MKLRARLGDGVFRVAATATSTVQDFCTALNAAAGLNLTCDDFTMSLNKRDTLDAAPDASLKSLGLCSGDTIWVSLTSAAAAAAPGQQQAQQQGRGPSTAEAAPQAAAMAPVASTSTAAGTRVLPAGSATVADSGPGSCAAAAGGGTGAHAEADGPAVDTSAAAGGAEAVDMELDEESSDLAEVLAAVVATPGHLRRVVRHAGGGAPADKLPHHLLLLAVHAVMLEAGFVPSAAPGQDALAGTPRPAGGAWCGRYVWPHGQQLPEAMVRAVTLGPHLVLHLLVAPATRVATLHLPIADYITTAPAPEAGASASPPPGSTTHPPARPPAAAVAAAPSGAPAAGPDPGRTQCAAQRQDPALAAFGDLRRLWRELKDGVALRLLAGVHHAVGACPPVGLLTLPMELKEAVLRLLPASGLAALMVTGSELRHLAGDDTFWRPLLLRDFPHTSAPDRMQAERTGWRREYIRQHHLRRMRRVRQRYLGARVADYMPPGEPFMPWPGSPFRVPVPVGGDYDRLPMPALGMGPGAFPGQLGQLPRPGLGGGMFGRGRPFGSLQGGGRYDRAW